MNLVKFFFALFLGSVISIPLVVLAGREVEELEGLDEFVWVPILIAMLSLLMKTIFEKKKK